MEVRWRTVRHPIAPLALLVCLQLAFLWKPVHVDDTNFLRLAEGARLDPWRPHNIEINWEGRTERAFSVLSNPPGIGWWLAPVAVAPVWVQHLWMLPWLGLAFWGAWTLGERFGGRERAGPAALLLCGSPLPLLAAQSLTPDLPLYACALAGTAGILRHQGGALIRRWPWALLLGCSALFRYSGAALVLLLILWPLFHRQAKAALVLGAAAALPLALLVLHDLHAYGSPHIVAMMGFQNVSGTGRDTLRKLVAAIALLGGAGVLPVLCWSRPGPALVGLCVGLLLGGAGASISSQAGVPLLATVLAAGAGGAVLGGTLRKDDREALWLSAWLVIGLVFLLKLRFVAGRYWLPFLAPAVLLPLRPASSRLLRVAVAVTLLLSLMLAWDDAQFARAQSRLAQRVLELANGEKGRFAGHWGWQHYMEEGGWVALEDAAAVPPGTLIAASSVAWPQSVAPGTCLEQVANLVERSSTPLLPRVHTVLGGANIHAFLISAQPRRETYAPWSFGRDPLDVVTVWRSCAPGARSRRDAPNRERTPAGRESPRDAERG